MSTDVDVIITSIMMSQGQAVIPDTSDNDINMLNVINIVPWYHSLMTH